MDIAIVTGANTRTGLAISRKLIEIGCRVYGLGKNFIGFPLENTDFIPVTCDLTNTEHLCQIVQEILDKEKDLYVLVNHARCLELAPHEKQELNDLEALVHTNLLAPLLLTRLALPSLIRLKGHVINIGFPDLPGSGKNGSAFLATEVALQAFSDRLFDEVRDDKVKVCSLILDTTGAEGLFEDGFTERDHDDLILSSESTAQAVEYLLSQKKESVVSRLVVRPQKSVPDETVRKELRKVSKPAPFVPKKPAVNVVIGRLQKEEVAPSKDKAPATYMDMAREVAEAEAKDPNVLNDQSDPRLNDDQSDSRSNDDQSDLPQPNRRKRRRRGRRRGPKDPQHTGDSKPAESELVPEARSNEDSGTPNPNRARNRNSRNRDTVEASKTPEASPITEPKPKAGSEVGQPSRGRSRNSQRRKPEASKPPLVESTTVNKPVGESVPAKKSAKKVSAKKVAKKKTPAKKVVADAPPVKKTAAKKTAKKRTAKKTVKKKTAPKPEDS